MSRKLVSLVAITIAVAAASPPSHSTNGVTGMGSRVAPAPAAREVPKRYTPEQLEAVPRYNIPAFAAPSSREVFVHKAKGDPLRPSPSMGREPMALGIDGRVLVPAGVQAVLVEVSSATAHHLRSAWRFEDDADYLVTVVPVVDPTNPLSNRSGSNLSGDRAIVWSAITTGDKQSVLVERVSPADRPWSFALERLAHFEKPLFENSNDFRPKGLGDSQWCQADIACVLDVLPTSEHPIVLAASRAVARMIVGLADGSAQYCTGTLLNSASFPRPYFLTAYHCIEGAVALDTYWFYSRSNCGYGSVSPATQVTGGARIEWSSRAVDSALLELRQTPPYPASYAGWDAATVPVYEGILAIHHPEGDVKKASLGQVWGANPAPLTFTGLGTYPAGTFYGVDWDVGIVEHGSSGSGFFTLARTGDALLLQGTLTGGNVSCSVSQKRTWYSRFDRIYPYIATALSVPSAPAATAAVEYYHAGFGHYFVTASTDETSKLDAGAFPGWARTGQSFKVYPLNWSGTANVCRFFTTAFAPRSSHFYTPSASECQTVKRNPTWTFEAEVFGMKVSDAYGTCPAGTTALYRLYNNGRSGAPNHRYTTSTAVRSQMLSQGWVSEGMGAMGVIGCVPN